MRIIEILLEDRVDFLRGKYLPIIRNKLGSALRIPGSLWASIRDYPGDTREEQIFSWLRTRDPTPNAQYLQWILGCAIDSAVPFEDLVYLQDTLERYHERKRTNTLPAEARDINRIKTPSQLDTLLRDVNKGEQASDAAEEAAARKASKILLDDADWLVLIPKTEKAAQFWGRGTEWCTAWGDPKGLHPKRDCRFNDYDGDGPLVIAIDKHDPSERYQFHQPSGQYMDRDDVSLGDMELVGLVHDDLKLSRVLAPYIRIDPAKIVRFSDNLPVGVQVAAVRQDPGLIRFIRDPAPETVAAVREMGYDHLGRPIGG